MGGGVTRHPVEFIITGGAYRLQVAFPRRAGGELCSVLVPRHVHGAAEAGGGPVGFPGQTLPDQNLVPNAALPVGHPGGRGARGGGIFSL